MQDTRNPYASPMATEMSPVAAQWLQSPSTSLTKVANGLGLIYMGIVVILFAIIGGILSLFLLARTPAMAATILAFIGLAVLAGVVLNIVGSVFCLATPEETGAAGMIYASVGAMGLGLLITVSSWLVALPPTMYLVQMVLNLAAGVTFLLFLRKLAQFIGRADFAAKAKSVLIWCGICAGIVPRLHRLHVRLC